MVLPRWEIRVFKGKEFLGSWTYVQEKTARKEVKMWLQNPRVQVYICDRRTRKIVQATPPEAN